MRALNNLSFIHFLNFKLFKSWYSWWWIVLVRGWLKFQTRFLTTHLLWTSATIRIWQWINYWFLNFYTWYQHHQQWLLWWVEIKTCLQIIDFLFTTTFGSGSIIDQYLILDYCDSRNYVQHESDKNQFVIEFIDRNWFQVFFTLHQRIIIFGSESQSAGVNPKLDIFFWCKVENWIVSCWKPIPMFLFRCEQFQ